MGPSRERELLILGLGNLICSDDGLGVRVVQDLSARYRPSPGVEVLDGGTLGLSLLAHVQGGEKLVLVDAVRTDDPPGTLVRLEGDDALPAVLHRLSPHQIGVADLLNALDLLGERPPLLVLLGLVPETIALGTELSPAVASGLAPLTEAVLAEASNLGFPFHARPSAHEVADGAPGERLALGL